ncbi:MAG: DoxX family protein [Cyclobacteriaceae bacterium]
MKKDISLTSLILRVSLGSMMLTHGYGKFMNLISGETGFADPFGLGQLPSLIFAVFAEFFCSIFLIVGFKSRLAAIPPAIVMLVAIFMIHWEDPWRRQEFPLLYLVGFIAIYLLGSGKYSLDWKLKKV